MTLNYKKTELYSVNSAGVLVYSKNTTSKK